MHANHPNEIDASVRGALGRLAATGTTLLDPVDGATHFDVPEHEARAMAADVAARLPG